MLHVSTPFGNLCLVALKIPTSDHGIAGSNPAGGENLPEPKRCFISQSLSCPPFNRPDTTCYGEKVSILIGLGMREEHL